MKLWFDVGIKRYTTGEVIIEEMISCGLMQESKDIQPIGEVIIEVTSCGLMQESKDIQLLERCSWAATVVV